MNLYVTRSVISFGKSSPTYHHNGFGQDWLQNQVLHNLILYNPAVCNEDSGMVAKKFRTFGIRGRRDSLFGWRLYAKLGGELHW